MRFPGVSITSIVSLAIEEIHKAKKEISSFLQALKYQIKDEIESR
jgi:hypothetical protein